MSALISIITPTFNSGQFLKETLDSLISQNFTQWECLLIDYGSTDNTLQIITNYSSRDNRFKLFIRNRNLKGASTCRNIGIEKAKSDYIIFLDSDDLLTPSCLQDRIEIAKKDNTLDYWVFPTTIYSISNGKEKHYPFNERSRFSDDLISFLMHEVPWTIMGPLWRKSVLVELNGFNEKFPRLQDPELHTRALLKKFKYNFYNDSQPDNYYRKKKSSVSPFEGSQNALNGGLLYIETFMSMRSSYPKEKKKIKTSLSFLYIKFLKIYVLYSNQDLIGCEFALAYKKLGLFTKSQKILIKFQLELKRLGLLEYRFIRSFSDRLWLL